MKEENKKNTLFTNSGMLILCLFMVYRAVSSRHGD